MGTAYGPALDTWVEQDPRPVDCVTALVDQFRKNAERRLFALGERYPLIFYTEQLSLGTPGALNPDDLAWLSGLCTRLQPLWIGAPLAFSRSHEVDLRGNLPLCLDTTTLDIVCEHATQIMEACGARLLFSNIASLIEVESPIAEPEFLNRLCAASGCGVRLDVTNLLMNAISHRFDPLDWVRGIDAENIVELRFGGLLESNGTSTLDGNGSIDAETWTVVEDILSQTSVDAITFERNGKSSPLSELETDLNRLRETVGATI